MSLYLTALGMVTDEGSAPVTPIGPEGCREWFFVSTRKPFISRGRSLVIESTVDAFIHSYHVIRHKMMPNGQRPASKGFLDLPGGMSSIIPRGIHEQC